VTANQSFPRSARDLRMVQVACILLALACGWLIHVTKGRSHDATPMHWFFVLAAIYCAVSGFTVQHKLIKRPAPVGKANAATLWSRWGAGNLMRLLMATSVSLWGAVLSAYRGPTWMAFTFFALGLVLLLIWTPGRTPVAEQPKASNRFGCV